MVLTCKVNSSLVHLKRNNKVIGTLELKGGEWKLTSITSSLDMVELGKILSHIYKINGYKLIYIEAKNDIIPGTGP